VEEVPQPLVTGRIVCGVDRLVLLAEELLALWFGEVPQDHQRIGGVFRRPRGHVTQLTSALLPVSCPQHRQGRRRFKAGSGHRPNDQLQPPPLDLLQSFLADCVISGANQISGSQKGRQRRQASGDLRRRTQTGIAASWLFRRRPATVRSRLTSEGVTGSKPVAPTRKEQRSHTQIHPTIVEMITIQIHELMSRRTEANKCLSHKLMPCRTARSAAWAAEALRPAW
jgi:hypothetical protein